MGAVHVEFACVHDSRHAGSLWCSSNSFLRCFLPMPTSGYRLDFVWRLRDWTEKNSWMLLIWGPIKCITGKLPCALLNSCFFSFINMHWPSWLHHSHQEYVLEKRQAPDTGINLFINMIGTLTCDFTKHVWDTQKKPSPRSRREHRQWEHQVHLSIHLLDTTRLSTNWWS